MKEAPAISIERHFLKLSEKETDELVEAFADLIVARVKKLGVPQARDGKTDDQRPGPDATEKS